jgi:signal transduction histidine kinase
MSRVSAETSGGECRKRDPAADLAAPERSTSESAARVTDRLSLLGEMTGGIAHDFRNVLAVIQSSLSLISRNENDPEKVRKFVAGAREGLSEGLELTSRLLAFAQQRDFEARPADANALLRSLELFLGYGAGPAIRVVLDLEPDIPRCLVDASQFNAALLNLVINARDAMPNGGKIKISTTPAAVGESGRGPAPRGNYVCVRVEDNGRGMPPETMRKIFQPFFTTKGDRGTGLGLPQVYAFMRRSGGYVDVASAPGRGTTVDLLFPVIAGETAQRRAQALAIRDVRCSPYFPEFVPPSQRVRRQADADASIRAFCRWKATGCLARWHMAVCAMDG